MTRYIYMLNWANIHKTDIQNNLFATIYFVITI